MELIPYIFNSNINDSLKCPFCHNIFSDPVLATGCGHSFCKNCTNGKKNCPYDKKEFQYIIPNLSLSDQISQLEIRCRYGCKLSPDEINYEIDENGCQEIIKLGERNAHEMTCAFCFVPCPQNQNCSPIRKNELSNHLEICQRISCYHSKYGCQFKGLKQELEMHLLNCPYEALKDYIVRTEKNLDNLQCVLNRKEQDLAASKSLIGMLIEKCDKTSEEMECYKRHVETELFSLRQDNNLFKDHLEDLNEFVNVLARQYEAMIFQQNFRCLGTFVGHQGPVWCLSAYGDRLFTGSSDNTIKVWDLSTEFACLKTIEGHTDSILCLTFVNKRLYSGGKDNKIGEWCLETLTNLQFIKNAHVKDYVSTLAGNDSLLFSGSNGSLKIWKASELHKGALFEINDLNAWVRCICCKDGLLYIGINKIQLRSLQNSIKDKIQYSVVTELDLPKPDSHVHSMIFVDRFLLCGTSHGDICIWDYTSRNLINILSGHTERVNCFTTMIIGGVCRIFSASNDRSIRIWRVDHMICTQILARHQGSVQSILWWKGRLFSGAVDTSVKVWVAGS